MIGVGRKWFYGDSDKIAKSYLIIRRIEHADGADVIHITVKDIFIAGELWDIAHLPIAKNILVESLKSQVEINSETSQQEFEEAYSLWKKDGGGI
jgi:hypothetical protein